MPLEVKFDKSMVEYFLRCLAEAKPIEGVETVHDMLALAGACHFVAMANRDVLRKEVDRARLPGEYREAAEEQFQAELTAAVEFFGHLAMLVCGGDFDSTYPARFRAMLSTSAGKISVNLLRGPGPTDQSGA